MLTRLYLIAASSVIFYVSVRGEGECPDIHGRTISPGLHYVPGPDTCTLCICENGQPHWCKAVLCSPPQDCKSFRLGSTCCEFICLDDTLGNKPGAGLDALQDLGLRLVAGAVLLLLLLAALLFTAHRLRQRKLRRPGRPLEDQRSLASIGYIGGSLSYLGGVCDDAPVHFPSLWKPPGNYFPRGEAPPPYDEAVAQARAEALSMGNMGGYHRSFPLGAAANVDSLLRSGGAEPSPAGRLATPFYLSGLSSLGSLSSSHTAGSSIADMRDRQVVVMANQPRNFTAQHSITSSAGSNNFISTLKITSSLAAISGRSRGAGGGGGGGASLREQTECSRASFLFNAPPAEQPQRALPSSSIEPARQHRTIPRMLSALDDQLLESPSSFMLKQRQSSASSSHPNMSRDGLGAFRSSAEQPPPRHSSSNQTNQRHTAGEPLIKMLNEDRMPHDKPSNNPPSARLSKENILRFVGNDNILVTRANPGADLPRSLSEVVRHPAADGRSEAEGSRTVVPDASKRPAAGSLGRLLERHPLLPVPVDTSTCGCSYEPEPLSMADDQDDYHSECENCKSTNGSRYYLDESEEGSELCETMTLHRRPLPEQDEDLRQLPTSLTLPVKTKRNRCPPGTRDAWFSSMPGTSSSEDD